MEWLYGDFVLPEDHPLYGFDVWEETKRFPPDYTVHIDRLECIICKKKVYDLDSAGVHEHSGSHHSYMSNVRYVYDLTYDSFIDFMNEAIEEIGNPMYCNEWSHDYFGTCGNCENLEIIQVGECRLFNCGECWYGLIHIMYTFMIEITDWYEEVESGVSMCRSDILCKKTFDSILCDEVLFSKTKPHELDGRTCVDCGYEVEECEDPGCGDRECPEHGDVDINMCYFCSGTRGCRICLSCSNCDSHRHCVDCDSRVFHDFMQYDSVLGTHWSIVPELIGIGSWSNIMAWLLNPENYIACNGMRCSPCVFWEGREVSPMIRGWHEQSFSNGFSSCVRTVGCPDCGDIFFKEAKVHSFVGDFCVDCGTFNRMRYGSHLTQ